MPSEEPSTPPGDGDSATAVAVLEVRLGDMPPLDVLDLDSGAKPRRVSVSGVAPLITVDGEKVNVQGVDFDSRKNKTQVGYSYTDPERALTIQVHRSCETAGQS